MDPEGKYPRTWRLRRFAGNIIRALMLGVALFVPVWGISVGIAVGVWGRSNINDTPGPQIFKGLEGLVLSICVSLVVLPLVGAQCAEHGDGVNPPQNAAGTAQIEPDADAQACAAGNAPFCTTESSTPAPGRVPDPSGANYADSEMSPLMSSAIYSFRG